MQKYRNSHSCNIHPVGTCSCGDFNYHSHPSGDSFSMIFSTKPTNHYHHHHKTFNEFEVSYPKITSSSSSPSVDCTLSLGTPSTRQTKVDKSFINHRKSTSCVWDMFQTTKQHQQLQNPSYNSSTTNATTRNVRSSGIGNNPINNNNNNNNTSSGSTRRCANCDTTSTPLWRNGPRGPKSLCNACGIRYKKEERRATITTTNSANPSNITNNDNNSCLNGGSGTTTSWPNHPSAHSTNQRVNSTSYHPTASLGNHHHHHEFRFIEDDHHRHRNSTSSTNFHSWRLNVATTDRPSLVHDYI